MISKGLMLAGAAATILAAFLPWVTVKGLSLTLDLGLVGAEASAGDRTVSGTDASLWPLLVGAGVAVAVLSLAGVAWRVALALGLLVSVAGLLLVVYMANVIDIETRGNGDLARVAADALLSSSLGPGTPLLLAGGVAIVLGALARSRTSGLSR